jgi:hypothetical protein
MQEPATGRARSIIAYDIARRLLYFASRAGDLSPVAATRRRIDELRERHSVTESEYHQLTCLLDSLNACDMDQEERIDDLIRELTLNLTIWHEEFPTKELERLRTLV